VAVEKVFTSNYFTIFEIKEEFDISQKKLEERYMQLQREFHPDNFFNSEEKNIASSKINMINNAFNTLASPIKRSEYLLDIKGINTTKISQENLKEIFLIQEEIDLMNEQEKSAELNKLYENNIKSLKDSFTETDNKNLPSTISSTNLQAIQKAIFLLKYIEHYKK